MVFDRRSLSYAALGLGPSWMLLDGIFAEVALFDRTQPEGLALATYLTAVSAVANTLVVPGHAVVQRRVHWSLRRWVGCAVYLQVLSALLIAAFWHHALGGASVALYVGVFATSLAGNAQQLALNPWAAETGRAPRIVAHLEDGRVGAAATEGAATCAADSAWVLANVTVMDLARPFSPLLHDAMRRMRKAVRRPPPSLDWTLSAGESVFGCDFKRNVRQPATVAACELACADSPKCRAFTFIAGEQICVLKNCARLSPAKGHDTTPTSAVRRFRGRGATRGSPASPWTAATSNEASSATRPWTCANERAHSNGDAERSRT